MIIVYDCGFRFVPITTEKHVVGNQNPPKKSVEIKVGYEAGPKKRKQSFAREPLLQRIRMQNGGGVLDASTASAVLLMWGEWGCY